MSRFDDMEKDIADLKEKVEILLDWKTKHEEFLMQCRGKADITGYVGKAMKLNDDFDVVKLNGRLSKIETKIGIG